MRERKGMRRGNGAQIYLNGSYAITDTTSELHPPPHQTQPLKSDFSTISICRAARACRHTLVVVPSLVTLASTAVSSLVV